MYKILIEKTAAKFLSKLDAKSHQLISNVIKKLRYFQEIKNLDVKPLKGKFRGMMRLRIGTRRILFTVEGREREIKIWLIENRGNTY